HHQAAVRSARAECAHPRRRARRSVADGHRSRPRPRDAGDGEGVGMSERVPVIVLGGSGYVAGEFLRLVHAHPLLDLGAAVSTSQTGEPIAAVFDHLAATYPEQTFASLDAVLERLGEA